MNSTDRFSLIAGLRSAAPLSEFPESVFEIQVRSDTDIAVSFYRPGTRVATCYILTLRQSSQSLGQWHASGTLPRGKNSQWIEPRDAKGERLPNPDAYISTAKTWEQIGREINRRVAFDYLVAFGAVLDRIARDESYENGKTALIFALEAAGKDVGARAIRRAALTDDRCSHLAGHNEVSFYNPHAPGFSDYSTHKFTGRATVNSGDSVDFALSLGPVQALKLVEFLKNL